MKPNTPQHDINKSLRDSIDQTEWMTQESAYESVDDLYQSDPDLFVTLATEWRDDNPWAGLGD